jgi:hypothetical protein
VNALVEYESQTAPAELGDFFAPVSADLIDQAVARYDADHAMMKEIAAIMFSKDYGRVLPHFVEGNFHDNRNTIASRFSNITDVFGLEKGVKVLDSQYWREIMALTDVYDCMPQKRRDEWNDQIREFKTPPFEIDTVRSTLMSLLDARSTFLAERVDGLFRQLSHNHVTNQPEGFSKRMILEYVIGSYGFIEHSRAGYINDLRSIIGRFMGRGELKYGSTEPLIKKALERTGKWLLIDGRALKIRVYKKGTCHIEIHPDIAWRLNEILASLHPMAIPAKFTKRPVKRKSKDFDLLLKPLPFEVLDQFSHMSMSKDQDRGTSYFIRQSYLTKGKETLKQFHEVIDQIDGVITGGNASFEYDASSVIAHIERTGCIPDFKSHQFYSTSGKLSKWACSFAKIEDTDTVLEPSAGTGGLAKYLPKDRTTCIEVNSMNCKVLEAKGFKNVIHEDFVSWATKPNLRFNKIVMNPPFSEGRALLHTQTAGDLLAFKGKLVAILPSSMKGKDILGEKFSHTWTKVIEREFENTEASVVILIAKRKND